MFKQAVNEAIPKLSAAITLYGYRIAHHPGATKQECQLQCVLKAPSLSRKALLECSGVSNLLVRDYLEKGKGSEDTTVLPRFWMVTAQRSPASLDVSRQSIGSREPPRHSESLAGIVGLACGHGC